MIQGTIAIVGRPNVGKSTFFNRLIGQRKSIVDDTPGVTRDRIYGEVEWLTKTYRIIDTGGIQIEDQPFAQEINMQVDIAIEEADVIVFLVSCKEGVMTDDMAIAKKLQKSGKPIVLVVNKVDNEKLRLDAYEFYALGLQDPFCVSSAHGIGLGDVLDEITRVMPEILKEDRVIVSNVEGTTRDAIDTPFTYDGQEYMIIDTAGIRKKGKIYENIEKYSILRALSAIDRSNVVLFLIDGSLGIREQDKHVAGLAHEAGKGVIIVYNKWDTVEKDEKTMAKIEKEIRAQFVYLDYAPIAFVSALTHQKVNQLLPLINQVHENCSLRIQTNVLNDVILDAQMMNPAKPHNGKQLKIYYSSQVSVEPPTFVLFVNDPELLHFSYKRYIENKIREAFGFEGTPIHIIARKKS